MSQQKSCTKTKLKIALFALVVSPHLLIQSEEKPAALLTKSSHINQGMLVLDASGSMWGQIDGKAKITIAKSVVSEIVNDWNANIPLGLTVYGHRKKADCTDIQVVQTPAELNKPAFLKQINSLQPKGKTPLSAAVKQAAESMEYKTKKASVILISDGKETCDLDPCEIGRELNSQGIDFTTHVISFDVPKDDMAGLKCLAEQTGGLFLTANNAKELKRAFKQAKMIVTNQDQLKITDATVSTVKEVVAGSVFKVKWSGPKNMGDRISIVNPSTTKSMNVRYIYRKEDKSPASLTAPETLGEYQVHYLLRDNRSLAQTAIKVIKANASIKTVEQVVAGSEFLVEWSGPQNQYDNIAIFDREKNKRLDYRFVYADSSGPISVRAPEQVGQYEVRYYTNGNRTLAKQIIQVVAAAASISAPKQIVAGSEFSVEWAGPKNQYDSIAIFETTKNKRLDYRFVYADSSAPISIRAPEQAGQYEVRYYTNGNKTLAKQIIQVIAAVASISAPKEIVAGSAFPVEWAGPKNQYDTITIFEKEKRMNYAYVSADSLSPISIKAPEKVGQYEVRYYTNGNRTLAKQTIQVIAATANISAPKSIIAGSEFSVEWSGPKNEYDTIGVFGPKNNERQYYKFVYSDSSSPMSLKAPEKAGQYEVRYYTNGNNTLASQVIMVSKK